MNRFIALAYGTAAYVTFLGTFLYAVAFVGNLWVPKSIDIASASGASSTLASFVINAALLTAFAFQHSIMAREGFKRIWTKVVPKSVERSTYVLFASLVLVLLFWQWRPMTTVVWSVEHPAAVLVINAAFWLGWLIVLVSTFLINHFELFGLRQVYARLRERSLPTPSFRTPLFYRYVRHPIYLGFIIAFWATPVMSVGHLLFAIATTGYILVGIQLEERDLMRQFGSRYGHYREQVGMLVPRPARRRAGPEVLDL